MIPRTANKLALFKLLFFSFLLFSCQSPEEDDSESLIEVFPTNATDQLYVKSSSLFKGHRFSIVDMTGKEVKTGIINADQIEIGISDLASGPYLFRIIGQASQVVKFIK
jgi:hypothetical protein